MFSLPKLVVFRTSKRNYFEVLLFSYVHNMNARLSSQMLRFFTRYLPTAFKLPLFIRVSESELFSSNCIKIAVECDWITKISQNGQFSINWKNRLVFWEKLNFFKIGEGRKFSVECVTFDIIS